ncbi:MAG TPA: imidazole glycerol phosphate synthase subunit HisH, partial [Bacteroidia bacterium]
YFVHSYFVPPNGYETATTSYGNSFCSAMNKDNFYAVQFHPERSGIAGEQVLKNFMQL